MSLPLRFRSRLQGHFQPLSVALIYGVLASLWILLSDRAVGWLFKDPALVLLASTTKGWLFVGVTTALVFVLLLRRERHTPDTPAPVRSLPWWGLAGLLLLVLAATGLAINGVWRGEREQAGKQLLAISESKAREVALWYSERQHDAHWLQADKDLQVNWLIWLHTRAPSALDALGQHLAGHLNDGHFRRASLLRPDGTVVWHSGGPTHAQEPEIKAGLARALQLNSTERVGPWTDSSGQLRLAFLAPVAADSESPAVVVLHLDPPPHLHPALAQWPLPQETAEAFLFTQEADQVRFLSARKFITADSHEHHLPLNTPELFTARVLRGDAQPNTVLDGLDYRGMAALGVVRAIEGTDWWLLAKQDRVELMGDAVLRSLWLMLLGLLSLLSASALVYLLTQRRHLQDMAHSYTTLQHMQAELGNSEARYRLLAENSVDVVWLYDLQRSQMVYISPSVEKMLGYRPDELVGHDALTLLLTPEAQTFAVGRLHARQQALAQGDTEAMSSVDELMHRHKDGHLVCVELLTTFVTNGQQQVLQLQGVSRDVTARKAAQTKITQLSQATEQSPASVIITNLRGEIEYVNAAFERNTGYTRQDVVGRNPRFLQSGQTPSGTYKTMWKALRAGDHWDGEVINRRRDGTLTVQSVTIAPVRGDTGAIERYLSVQLDVTAQREAEATAHRLAWFDPLTGLPNRHRLLTELANSLAADRRQGGHSAIVLINLDRFKTVNEALGHAAGDALLRQLTQRLGQLQAPGDMLARLGADEFALLQHAQEQQAAATSATALRTAQAVHAALVAPFALESGETINVTASVGVALLPHDATDTPGDVLRRADTALHRAKAGGGQQSAFFDAAMGQVVSERFAVEQDLRRGLAAQELRLYLQPQVNRQGHMVSAEALVRWQHPDKGLVPPGTFIGVAEESDLITEVGDWVLAQVCAHLGQLHTQGRRLPIAVNVSPRQFHKADFVPGVLHALEQAGAQPEDLVLEITEGVVIEQVDTVVRKMSQLTQRGVRFSIDDFGTGYSSLAYLKRLPIHELKIDKSFVQDAPHDPSDAALVEAILSVAGHLRLKVVAEGVETQEQADFLNQRANVIHQGYLFGRPAPAAEVLATWSGTRSDGASAA
ncbi:EAL domain-containing protein [Hydrogenophaga atypica]|uniref:EAL domain-containing protein n=1 Tax=Hydrogenophaga atypica TaxID=249409 RepID=A0ABW2QKI2_9BURK